MGRMFSQQDRAIRGQADFPGDPLAPGRFAAGGQRANGRFMERHVRDEFFGARFDEPDERRLYRSATCPLATGWAHDRLGHHAHVPTTRELRNKGGA